MKGILGEIESAYTCIETGLQEEYDEYGQGYGFGCALIVAILIAIAMMSVFLSGSPQ